MFGIFDCINEVTAAIAAASAASSGMSGDAYVVQTTPRLAQWRLASIPAFSYRTSNPFKIGLWNWYLTVERSKQLVVKLYPEVSGVTRGQPPIASFTIKLISSPNRKTIFHPGVCDRQLKKNDDFVWPIDTLYNGRFIVNVEFIDLKIVPPTGGEPVSIWTGYHIMMKHSIETALSSLGRMLSEGIHTDIIINATDGSISAHRAVLATRSSVFRSMFFHNLKEKELSTINITDMSFDACQAFLNFIYGNCQADEFLTHRLALLRAADKYDISDLKEACHESLREDIDTKNVLERLQTAQLYRLPGLKSCCMRYLVNFGNIYEIHDDFNAFLHTADRELIAEIFEEVLSAWKGF